MSGARFDRDGCELADPGLYVDLPARGFHVLAVNLVPSQASPS